MMETIDTSNPLKPSIIKDPGARLDYTWDWTDWLTGISDTIESAVVTPSGTLTATPGAVSAGRVTSYVAGGTAGATETVVCRVTTVGGRIDERTLYFRVKQR